MRSLLRISNGVTYSIPQKVLILPKFTIFSLKSFWILSLASIMFLLAFYVFQINAVVSESYQVQNFQKKINEFSEENKILEINFTQINSLENIEQKIQELGFEKIGKIHYIQILESSVVAK